MFASTLSTEKPEESAVFLLVKTHKHLTAVVVFTVRVKRVNYILSNDFCKPLERYVYARKKHPSSGYPAAKHPKHSKFAITDIREKPVNFFYCSAWASTLASATILLTQVPLQQFPFLFISIIPCVAKQIELELSFLIVFESTFLICQT